MLVFGSLVMPGRSVAAEAAWYNCLTREVFTPEKQAWCNRWQTLKNTTYIVPTSLDETSEYHSVMRDFGRYQNQTDRLFVQLVNEQNWIAFGDMNNDGKQDASVVFGVASDPEGRDVATYLTVVLDVDGEAQALTSVRLGERIMLNGPIAIGDERVTVPFLTQTEVINRNYGIEGTALVLL